MIKRLTTIIAVLALATMTTTGVALAKSGPSNAVRQATTAAAVETTTEDEQGEEATATTEAAEDEQGEEATATTEAAEDEQ
jgi:Flp pilus assembly protein TadG